MRLSGQWSECTVTEQWSVLAQDWRPVLEQRRNIQVSFHELRNTYTYKGRNRAYPYKGAWKLGIEKLGIKTGDKNWGFVRSINYNNIEEIKKSSLNSLLKLWKLAFVYN